MNCILLINFVLVLNIQSVMVVSLLVFVIYTVKQRISNIMQQSTIILTTVQKKYKRAYNELTNYLEKNKALFNFDTNNLNDIDFKVLRSLFYSLFDSSSILVSVSPYDIKSTTDKKTKCSWQYFINIDGTEIREGSLPNRETAEFIAFNKAFQFLDTKLFISDTKERFYDETSDSSCLSVNWQHLDKVLDYKRRNVFA